MGKETALPKVLRFNAGKTEKFDITEDTAITIAENAGKMFDKIREVLANKNMNNDLKIDVIRLLIKD